MIWRIELSESALRGLRRLDKAAARRILAFLEQRPAAAENPRRLGKPLRGPLGEFWRYRVGDYRIVCAIENDILRILAVRIAHRRDVYR